MYIWLIYTFTDWHGKQGFIVHNFLPFTSIRQVPHKIYSYVNSDTTKRSKNIWWYSNNKRLLLRSIFFCKTKLITKTFFSTMSSHSDFCTFVVLVYCTFFFDARLFYWPKVLSPLMRGRCFWPPGTTGRRLWPPWAGRLTSTRLLLSASISCIFLPDLNVFQSVWICGF